VNVYVEFTKRVRGTLFNSTSARNPLQLDHLSPRPPLIHGPCHLHYLLRHRNFFIPCLFGICYPAHFEDPPANQIMPSSRKVKGMPSQMYVLVVLVYMATLMDTCSPLSDEFVMDSETESGRTLPV
jgi:hypothetical protein